MVKQYIPEQNDIVWLDFDPVKGKEIGKYRPALVLSSKEYNKSSGLLICCPISTSIRGQKTEVQVKNLEKPSVVASNLIHTLSWKERKVKFIKKAENNIFDKVILNLIPLIGADKVIEKNLE
ncbi:MAG: MazF family transcriptional regulator [Gammaproteobacteria bacterium]|nr:MAG: MazF family transcriptional regulator [Gammaproteobacteria bacterium]